MERVILKPREEARIERGHPWVFDNEVDIVSGPVEPGAVVDVESSRKTYLGRGFYNPNSKIRVRITTRSKDGIDQGYIMRRLKAALEYRSLFLDPRMDSFRLVFAEADFLPGLIVDCFNTVEGKRYLSCQFLSLGMEIRKADIVSGLVILLAPDGIAERSDAPVRELEGLNPVKGIAYGEIPDRITFRENGLIFRTSLLDAQKTGWFHDQRENRKEAARYAAGRKCLDVCSNSGGFAIGLAASGAVSVEAVDSQENALTQLEENAELNGVREKITTVRENAFEYLRALEKDKVRYGLIVLDPPAFAKTKAHVQDAIRGYKDLNMRALKLLEPGGILVTCSCSHYVGLGEFTTAIANAAKDAGTALRIMETRFQAKDHPVLLGYDESLYLKCIIARVG